MKTIPYIDWQPIETAPKYEDEYIIGRIGKIGVLPCTWDADDQCWLSWNGFYERQFNKPFEPTHWIPLSPPEPPNGNV